MMFPPIIPARTGAMLLLAALLSGAAAGCSESRPRKVAPQAMSEEESAPALETFSTADGGEIEGARFGEGAERVVILFHGQVFNKESWYAFARELNAAGIDAFAVDFRGYGASRAPTAGAYELDVRGAIAHLEAAGYEHIGLLGGSMGGAAVLRALADDTPAAVDRVAILAAPGPPIDTVSIGKLFVAAEGDPVYPRTRSAFEASAEPKDFLQLEGNDHAQHLFASPEADRLTAALIEFFRSP